jgi:hypothetical protein
MSLVIVVSVLLVTTDAAPPPIILEQRPVPLSDQEACNILNQISEDLTKELPKMVDATTRLDGMVTLCSLRTVKASKFIIAPLSNMRSGWRERKQAQWNDIVCGNEAFLPLARRGWRFTQTLTFVGGERVNMDARCK